MGGVAVPKTGQKNALPCGDVSEVPMGKVAVSKGAHSTVHRLVRHRFSAGLPRGDGSGALVGRGAVPKTGQKTPSPRGDGSEVSVGRGAVPKGALTELIEL